VYITNPQSSKPQSSKPQSSKPQSSKPQSSKPQSSKLPSSKLIKELRGTPHDCRYEPDNAPMPRYLAFYGRHPGPTGLIGLIDYQTEPARAFRVVDGVYEEIL
jgi:hypothetical protein